MNTVERHRYAQYFRSLTDQTSKNFSFGPVGPFYSNDDLAKAIEDGTDLGMSMCAMFERYAARNGKTTEQLLNDFTSWKKRRGNYYANSLYAWTYLPP
jgi:hypothetical protein